MRSDAEGRLFGWYLRWLSTAKAGLIRRSAARLFGRPVPRHEVPDLAQAVTAYAIERHRGGRQPFGDPQRVWPPKGRYLHRQVQRALLAGAGHERLSAPPSCPPGDPVPSVHELVEARLLEAARLTWLDEALGNLLRTRPDDHICLLLLLAGRSNEAGKLLGISADAYRQRCRRARAHVATLPVAA